MNCSLHRSIIHLLLWQRPFFVCLAPSQDKYCVTAITAHVWTIVEYFFTLRSSFLSVFNVVFHTSTHWFNFWAWIFSLHGWTQRKIRITMHKMTPPWCMFVSWSNGYATIAGTIWNLCFRFMEQLKKASLRVGSSFWCKSASSNYKSTQPKLDQWCVRRSNAKQHLKFQRFFCPVRCQFYEVAHWVSIEFNRACVHIHSIAGRSIYDCKPLPYDCCLLCAYRLPLFCGFHNVISCF